MLMCLYLPRLDLELRFEHVIAGSFSRLLTPAVISAIILLMRNYLFHSADSSKGRIGNLF
jgi:hypothetical protein